MAGADGPEVKPQHLFCGLQAPGLDAQKKSFLYQERDPEKRREFMRQLEQVASGDRVYVDEAGVEDSLSYAYGWSPRGVRCPGERLGHHTQRISMAGAWCEGRILAPLTFEGYCNAALVEAWFEQQLCPVLRAGQVVILDNASFHVMTRLRGLLEKVGCSLLPLPPYSPDLNKIESLWNTLKLTMALDTKPYPSFRDKVDAAFM